MSHGLYLYCLREPTGSSSETCHALSVIKSPGVNGRGGVFIRVFNGIEAVLGEVNPDDFGEMQKKAQGDIQWIKEKALAHEAVVEEAMGLSINSMDKNSKDAAGPEARALPMIDSGKGRATASPPCRPDLIPVIPVKFGVIFKTEQRLAEVINSQCAAVKSAFDRIRGKQEWGVKIFLKDAGKFRELARMENDNLREKSKKIAELPAGRAYFMETEFNEELERECSRRLDKEAQQAYEQLKSYAAVAVMVKLLGRELTGREERMVLNSAYLIADIHLPEFTNAAAKLREKLGLEGFLVEQSGPWPAYHFTEFAHE